MRRHAKATSAATTASTGTTRARKSLFGIACACVLGLVAFVGSGAPAAGAAEGCPNEQFRTGPGALLPECRAYEQVSPTDKNGADILSTPGVGVLGADTSDPVAAEGDAAIMRSLGEFADIAFGGRLGVLPYIARRGTDGWHTNSMIPRPQGEGNAVTGGSLGGLSNLSLSNSLVTSEALLTQEPLPEGTRLYMRDHVAGSLSALVTLPNFNGFLTRTATPDLEHIVFGSPGLLTSDPGLPDNNTSKVFELIDNQVRLVSVKPDGTPFQENSLPAGGNIGAGAATSNAGGVSEDGEHIFFSTPTSGNIEIYRRSHGTTTLHVSESQRIPVDPNGVQEKRFKIATPDGNRVLFTSSELLTDDANTGPSRFGSDLYRYDVEADELIDISATTPDGDDGAQVQGVVGIDEDAERVYYVGLGEVASGQGTPGQPSLYLWEDDGSADGQTRFIATLLPRVESFPIDPGDSGNWRSWDGSKTARTSADGRYLLFQSAAPIPGHDNSGPECVQLFNEQGNPTGEYGPGICSQIYRYDAEANGGAGELECVSCNPEGEAPIGPSLVITSANSDQLWDQPRNLSDDGSRVFFTSRDALVERDANGKDDAYMWKDGEVHLLSSGTSSDHSIFYNASLNGDDAFILTRDQLVPQDGDSLKDLYTAHVNGGFASQFATLPPNCSGEECRKGGTNPPTSEGPLSASFQGNGNTPKTPAQRCPKGKRKVKARNGKARCVKKSAKRNQQNRASDNRRASR